MKEPRRSLLVECKGIAAMEFALLGPVFLLLLLSVIQVSFLLWTKSAVQTVASQTARCTALGDPTCENSQAFATSLLDTWGVAGFVSSINVSVQPGATCNNVAGRFSVVTINGAASSFMNFVPLLSGITITGSACYPSAP